MDNRSRQNVAGMPTATSKSSLDMNGVGSNRQHARRKTHTKKVKRQPTTNTGYRSMSEFQPPPSCWMPLSQQRLFPAVSDSAVGGCPMYSVEYQPVFHPVAMTSHRCNGLLHTERPNSEYGPLLTNSEYGPLHTSREYGPLHTNSEYTSLPPNTVLCQSESQRRFSDPGLANGLDSDDEESAASCTGDDCNATLTERVNCLTRENHRLRADLKETRRELQELKMEMNAWKESRPSYEPGMVSDMVCEVRESMKVHQEVLLARLKQTTPQVNDRLTLKEFDDLKKKLQNVTNEKESLSDRLKRLEEQMQTVMVHNSLQESNQQELVVLEQEKLKLRRELQEEIDARKTAESQFRSLEHVLGALRKKKINGIVEDKMAADGDHVTSGESLMSSLGSGSMHSPHVTMSGPVTDL
ncbi:uncharacterized protein LOC111046336 [Nilaparvata lugens]|uniref:uncharacterized protein LOC111046336 n=1 Tax=Nilaparvata lugens TaxID=108931 RepID=UPI00193E3C00|nr:uncharacterized protein LOC111046336 [Nilaparvata lugens]